MMTMKTRNIFRILATMTVMSLVAVSCGQEIDPVDPNGNETPSTVTPVFPSLVENYEVKPGETLTFDIVPNLDWTISLPETNPQWFSILDGKVKVTKLSGKASSEKITISVVVSEKEEFDNNRSADIEMTMGGQTKVIAKYMRPAKEKTLVVYAAERDEAGELRLAEDGESYVYSSTPATSVSLEWSDANAAFCAPVKIESNCEWVLENNLEWLDCNIPENTNGVVELFFVGQSIDAAEGTIAFKSGDKVVNLNVSIPSCAEIDIFAAQVDEDDWIYDESGDYLWTEDPVSSVTLVWMSGYRMPIKVDSKCNWTLEVPEWLTVNIPETTSGVVTVNLMGDPQKYPMDDESGKVSFIFNDEVIYELDIVIPGCRNIISHTIGMALTALEYSYTGELSTEMGYVEEAASATITGTSEAAVVAVENKNGVYDVENPNPEWIKIKVSDYQQASDIIQTRDVEISVTENGADERSAAIFFLPSNMSGKLATLFSDDKTQIKEEYLASSISLVQHSNDMEYLSVHSTEEEMASVGVTFNIASDEKKEALASHFGDVRYAYTLQYSYTYSRDEAFLQMVRPFTSYKVFDQDFTDKTSEASFWLTYSNQAEANNFGVIDMYKDGKLPLESSIGYVVFYDSKGEVLAVVECVSPKIVPTLDVDHSAVTFTTAASSETINLSSNMSWTITSDATWCTVNPASGEGNTVITISAEENTDPKARVANLTITCVGTDLTMTITVNQDGLLGGAEEHYEFVNGDDLMHFLDPEAAEAAFASLVRIKSGDLYDGWKEYNCPIYHLTYLTDDRPLTITPLPSKAKIYSVNPYSNRHCFKVNNLNYDSSVGQFKLVDGGVTISMQMPEGSNQKKINGTILFYDGNQSVVLVLCCTLDLSYYNN